MSERGTFKSLFVLMAIVFVDMIGFLMVLPLLPFYAEHLGGSAVVVGELVSAFALAQLLTAPLWGRLSDRYGRRPMLLVGLAASAIAYILFGLANALWVLFLSRLVQGAGGGTTSVVQAYVSDTVPPRERAKALGWISAATSAGVMIGPAIASLSTSMSASAPGFIAAGLCLANLTGAAIWLPEPAAERKRATRVAERSREPGALRREMAHVLRHPFDRVSSLIWIYTAGMMAFMAMNGVLALFLERRYGVSEHTIGWFFVYVGAISVVMRSLVIGPTVKKLGEVRTLKLGALALAIGIAAVPLPHHLLGLALAVLLVPVGTALLFPSTTSLVTSRGPQHATGRILGVQQTFGGVARLLGPVWAGVLFEHVGIAWPFWVAGGLVLLMRFFARVVKPESDDFEEPATEASGEAAANL